jgi:NitT/TauT family transport system ATP-binding protein
MDDKTAYILSRRETTAAGTEAAAVAVDGVQKRYREALFSPVSFTLAPAFGLGVIGRNGSGKSTLLDMIAGIARPDAGTIKTNGQVGYVMQRDDLSDLLSCRENLLFEAALRRLPRDIAARRVENCAALCGIAFFLNKRLSRCSAGMRQRVNIAAALLSEPAVLLLDEAFSNLDAQSVRDLRDVFADRKAGGAAVIVVSHDPEDFADLCDRTLQLPDATVRSLA